MTVKRLNMKRETKMFLSELDEKGKNKQSRGRAMLKPCQVETVMLKKLYFELKEITNNNHNSF